MAPRQQILTTEVSMWVETKREVGPSWLLSDVNELGLRHVLLVRFHTGESCKCRPWEGQCICTPWNTPEGEAAFLERVRDIVRRDCEEQSDVPRIDALCLHEISVGGPSREFVQAVRGLHPRLLWVDCGFGEECNLGSFNALNEIWPLKTLEIINWCCNGQFGVHLHPAYLSRHIRSLHLHFCCDVVEFPRIGPTSTLRELSITESFAFDTFHTLGATTCLLERLHTLRISTCHGDWLDTEPEEVLRTLERMRSLRALELAFGPWVVLRDAYAPFRQIQNHLPGSLEACRIRGPSDLVSDTEDWIELMKDEHWIPDLKEFTLKLDVWGSTNKYRTEDDDGEDKDEAGKLALEAAAFMPPASFMPGNNGAPVDFNAIRWPATKKATIEEGRRKSRGYVRSSRRFDPMFA